MPPVARRHGGQGFAATLQARFLALMDEVMRLNRQVFELGLYVLVFPQGTRSVRLSRGHTGMMQVAQHLHCPSCPSGAREVTGSTRATSLREGRCIVYRCGAPIHPDGPEIGEYRVTESFMPMTTAATTAHGAAFSPRPTS